MIYALYVFYPATGRTSVLTFASAFDRALQLITLSAQPVRLRCVEWAA